MSRTRMATIPDAGERVRNAIYAKDVKMGDIINNTGISQATLSNLIYYGVDISAYRLAKICAYLGISMDYVMGIKKKTQNEIDMMMTIESIKKLIEEY